MEKVPPELGTPPGQVMTSTPSLPFPGPCSRQAEPLATLHSGDLGFEQPPLDSAPWRGQGGTCWTWARTQARQWEAQGRFWNLPRR